LDVFQSAIVIRPLTLIQILETSIQIPDNRAVENIFYQGFQSNCVVIEEAGSMAL